MKALILIPSRSHIDCRLLSAITESELPHLPAYGMSDLPLCRSKLIGLGLATGAERLILVDDDVVPTAAQLRQLATTDSVTARAAVFGLYTLRHGRSWSVDAVDPDCAATAERFAIRWGGLGLCAIHRESLERVAESLPALDNDGPWWPFCVPFLRNVDGKATYFADDRSLCQHLIDTGTLLIADKSLTAGHVISYVVSAPFVNRP